ncbi:MAG: aspartate aminotransferase family protein [Verrucomicrobia bacterium]|nr:aspartate aminotransferase family protein [Verrucomicrobiota bacterium]
MNDLPVLRTKVPGPKSRTLARRLRRHEAPTVTCLTGKGPIFWKRAEGVHVWDVDGNRFLDLTSAFGVASLGHSHPEVVAAIHKQSALLCHGMGDVHPSEAKTRLCARLSEITFERWSHGRCGGQALLCNSGFEAVEAALKTAMLFTRKRGVIVFEGAYHGLGYGALETTWRRDFRLPFAEQLGGFAEFVPYPRQSSAAADRAGAPTAEIPLLSAIEGQILGVLRRREIGAILVEPFQGRAGEVIPPPGFIPMLRRICDRHRLLLIADEIYVGFWRTGRWFAVEHSGVTPDLICLGKALSGCLPISACVGKAGVMAAWPVSQGEALHTSTFGGNPLACAAALASIRQFERRAASWDVTQKGAEFVGELRRLLAGNPWVRDIRGVGLLIGIEFAANGPVQPPILCERLLDRGLIALPSGSRAEALAITPPLCMDARTLSWAARQTAEVVSGATSAAIKRRVR